MHHAISSSHLVSWRECSDSSLVASASDSCDSELEKLGPKYRVALMSKCSFNGWFILLRTDGCLVARDERWTRLTCDHKGTYADDVRGIPSPDPLARLSS
jgi:U3 small nucleolar RNA-associated protein 24